MRNHGPDTVNVALYVSTCCADIERNRSNKRRRLFARNHALHPWTLSLCVFVCMPALVVAVLIAYWLWVSKETFSKPVFGVSKTSISGFVAVGPHCIIYIYNIWFFLIHCSLCTLDMRLIKALSTYLFVGPAGLPGFHYVLLMVPISPSRVSLLMFEKF